jgi:hypothetical protein
MWRAKAIEYRGFSLIQIWKLQNDLVAGWPFVPFAHMSGLHAAGMHKIDRAKKSGLEKCVGDFTLAEDLNSPVDGFLDGRASVATY